MWHGRVPWIGLSSSRDRSWPPPRFYPRSSRPRPARSALGIGIDIGIGASRRRAEEANLSADCSVYGAVFSEQPPGPLVHLLYLPLGPSALVPLCSSAPLPLCPSPGPANASLPTVVARHLFPLSLLPTAVMQRPAEPKSRISQR